MEKIQTADFSFVRSNPTARIAIADKHSVSSKVIDHCRWCWLSLRWVSPQWIPLNLFAHRLVLLVTREWWKWWHFVAHHWFDWISSMFLLCRWRTICKTQFINWWPMVSSGKDFSAVLWSLEENINRIIEGKVQWTWLSFIKRCMSKASVGRVEFC